MPSSLTFQKLLIQFTGLLLLTLRALENFQIFSYIGSISAYPQLPFRCKLTESLMGFTRVQEAPVKAVHCHRICLSFV